MSHRVRRTRAAGRMATVLTAALAAAAAVGGASARVERGAEAGPPIYAAIRCSGFDCKDILARLDPLTFERRATTTVARFSTPQLVLSPDATELALIEGPDIRFLDAQTLEPRGVLDEPTRYFTGLRWRWPA